jgi:methyl-accepting chemotaxis protein
VIQVLKRTKISTRLCTIIGAALLALCATGAIAVFAAHQIQQLGQELRSESAAFSNTEITVLVDIERAIGAVHSAPSELDLAQLKAKRQQFQSWLAEADKNLKDTVGSSRSQRIEAASGELAAAIRAFKDAAQKVFDFSASFAQQQAVQALQKTVAPTESAVKSALQHFHEAADRNSADKEAAISAAIATLNAFVVALVVLLVVVLAAASYLVVLRGVVRPIRGMTNVMRQLAQGNFETIVPGLDRGDEIGEMASSVQVFKDSLAETARLRAERAEDEKRIAAQRTADMRRLADEFQAAVGGIIDTVSSTSTELEAAAGTLTQTAETTTSLAVAVTTVSDEASSNVNSVASASHELAESIGQIAQKVQESTRIAAGAVREAQQTNARIEQLSQAAARIGDVVKLITNVAEQTNLLALNATIEAARAGDAGKGFAVVAHEVKALAAQTAKATDEIGNQIAGMQSSTADCVTAIKQIGITIGRVAEIASAIALSVEQQGAATQAISANVQRAAKGTSQVVTHIADVNRGATETGSASAQVHSSAQSLANESNRLKLEVDKFLNTIRAA